MSGIIRVNGRTYRVPQKDFAIANAYDNHVHVYRISIGIPNVTGFERAFKAIDRSTDGAFFEGKIEFIDSTGKLTMGLALVSKTETDYGIFYELEAMPNDTNIVKDEYGSNGIDSTLESSTFNTNSDAASTQKRRSRRRRPVRG